MAASTLGLKRLNTAGLLGERAGAVPVGLRFDEVGSRPHAVEVEQLRRVTDVAIGGGCYRAQLYQLFQDL
ncbi:MAG: hypothetical protein V9F03_02080 [Microthrixaceae bacterium]